MADSTASPSPLPRNPSSEVGMLAHHLITTRDLSALSPLVDALNERARYDEAGELRRAFVGVARDAAGMHGYSGQPSVRLSWETFATKVERLLWWDMYDWDAGVTAVGVGLENSEDTGEGWVEVGEPKTSTIDHGYATPAEMRASLTVDVSNLPITELRELRNMISQQYGVPTYAYDPGDMGDDTDGTDEPADQDKTDLHEEKKPDEPAAS